MTTKKLHWLWVPLGSFSVFAATLGLIAGLAYYKYEQIQQASKQGPPPIPPTPVGIRTVEPVVYRNQTTAVGTVLAPRSITLSNELPGTVDQVKFQPGATVEPEQVLLTLDTSVEQAQLQAAEARVKFTESTYRRTQQMAATKAVTELELEETESQWKQATAQVAELKAVIARKTIKAPFRARAGLSDTHVGQYLPAGSLITTLQSIDNYLYVDFMISQTIVRWLEVGQAVTLFIGNSEYQATIEALDAQADRSTRNVRVRARWTEPPALAVPGDSVQVVVAYGPEMNYPAVPAESVRRSPQGTFVFLVEENAEQQLVARQTPVIIGVTVGKQVGIANGLKSGDRVVADGSFKLRDGESIAPAQILLDSPPPAK